jgi:hypothetical protein
VRQAAKRQRAQASESGCDRDALEDRAFAAEARLTSDRGAEEKETARHHHARSCRVEGPAVVLAVHGGGRTGNASDGYARKDRDSAQVMDLPGTSWSGRGGIGLPPVLLAGTLVRKVTNVIGDEQSRAQPVGVMPWNRLSTCMFRSSRPVCGGAESSMCRDELPSRLIPHRHRSRAEFQPAHELQVDMLR